MPPAKIPRIEEFVVDGSSDSDLHFRNARSHPQIPSTTALSRHTTMNKLPTHGSNLPTLCLEMCDISASRADEIDLPSSVTELPDLALHSIAGQLTVKRDDLFADLDNASSALVGTPSPPRHSNHDRSSDTHNKASQVDGSMQGERPAQCDPGIAEDVETVLRSVQQFGNLLEQFLKQGTRVLGDMDDLEKSILALDEEHKEMKAAKSHLGIMGEQLQNSSKKCQNNNQALHALIKQQRLDKKRLVLQIGKQKSVFQTLQISFDEIQRASLELENEYALLRLQVEDMKDELGRPNI